MTTINTTLNLATPSSPAGNADNNISAQMSRLTSQITKLTKQLKDIAAGEGSIDEKREQQQLIQAQIKMLQAQLAQLQRQQAEQSEQSAQKSTAQETGINRPTDGNKIDIYV